MIRAVDGGGACTGNDDVTAESVSQVTGVAEQTIRGVYRDLYPYIHEIIPDWYMDARTVTMKLPPPTS